MLVGIYIGLGVLAVLSLIVLSDNIKKDDGDGSAARTSFSVHLLIATFKLNADRKQLLLIPLTVYVGMSPAFMMAEFTKVNTGASPPQNAILPFSQYILKTA